MRQVVRKSRAEANNVDTTKWRYTLLLDMNNIMKISFVDKRTGENGVEYGMVYEALNLIGRVLDKKDFNFCVACYDGHGSGVLRYNYYKGYKANRGKEYGKSEYDKACDEFVRYVLSKGKSERAALGKESEEDSFERQSYVIKEVLEELCVRQYEFDDVEGDDIIANYVKNKAADEKVVIVSTDKDLTQLISEEVIVYNPREKWFITASDSADKIGIRHDNVVLAKVLCGDASDNIKGIKGLGEASLVKYFPQIRERKVLLEEIIDESARIQEERTRNKKKPLAVLGNIINRVTDGEQGKDIYEVNGKIIDLSEPMLTEEARNEMADTMRVPMDISDRSVENVYRVLKDAGMDEMLSEGLFGAIFGRFTRIITMEGKLFKAYVESQKV